MNVLQRFLATQYELPCFRLNVVILFNKVILLLSLHILTKRDNVLKDRLVLLVFSLLSLNDCPIFDEAVPLVFVLLHHPSYLA
jgi:hypothetical protein